MIGTNKVHHKCSGSADFSSLRLSSQALCRTRPERKGLLLTNLASNSLFMMTKSGLTSSRSPMQDALFTESISKAASGTTRITDSLTAILRSCSSSCHWCIFTQCSTEKSLSLASTTAHFTRFLAEPVPCQPQATQPTTSSWWSCPQSRNKTSGSSPVSLASWPLSSEPKL